jgi:hypothetical protein
MNQNRKRIYSVNVAYANSFTSWNPRVLASTNFHCSVTIANKKCTKDQKSDEYSRLILGKRDEPSDSGSLNNILNFYYCVAPPFNHSKINALCSLEQGDAAPRSVVRDAAERLILRAINSACQNARLKRRESESKEGRCCLRFVKRKCSKNGGLATVGSPGLCVGVVNVHPVWLLILVWSRAYSVKRKEKLREVGG